MQHPDEGTIHAWLDGALSQQEGAALEAHAAECAACRAAVAEARGLVAASSRIVSALDIVPGGVIPAPAAARRAWYAGPQLRAAAAILFVAGVSVLLVRGRGSEPLRDTAQRVMSEAAPAPDAATAEGKAPAATELSSPAAKTAEGTPQRDLRRAAPNREAMGTTGAIAGTGAAADEAEAAIAPAELPTPAAAPTAAPPPPPAAAQQPFNKAVVPENLVVTGATVQAAPEVAVIGIDSAAGVRITRYRLATGEEVTLRETPLAMADAVVSAQAERRSESARALALPAAPPPPPPMRADSTALPISTISWTDPKSGRRYTLSGRVPRARLEELRRKIQPVNR